MTARSGQQPEWAKEGKYWTRTSRGWAAAPSAVRLKVMTEGRVSVKAEDRQDISYVWTQRVSASSRDSAGKRLEGSQVKTFEKGEWLVLETSDPRGEAASSEFIVTVPKRLRDLRVESATGSVVAKYVEGDIVGVTSAGNIEMDEIAGNVVARTGGGSMTFGSVKGKLRGISGGGSIRVASVGGETALETAGGEIYVEEAADSLQLSTSGNIHVGRVLRDVFAHTTGGIIEVERADGMVTAETGGGPIQIGGARGVRCESAGGTIKMKNVSGSVRASTASGGIFAAFATGQPLENSLLVSGKGDITVTLPSNLAVTIKALSESGGWGNRVTSEFSEVRVRNAKVGSDAPVAAQGALNGGGPVLMLSAGNGNIFLLRAK